VPGLCFLSVSLLSVKRRASYTVSPALCCIQKHIKRVLEQIGDAFKVVYLIFDGELGHHDAMHMVSQGGRHLISKLRYNSALSFPYDGPYCGRGPRRKYGQKLDDRTMASEYLQATCIDEDIETSIYQMSQIPPDLMNRLLSVALPVGVQFSRRETILGTRRLHECQ
jgi:putative transposase